MNRFHAGLAFGAYLSLAASLPMGAQNVIGVSVLTATETQVTAYAETFLDLASDGIYHLDQCMVSRAVLSGSALPATDFTGTAVLTPGPSVRSVSPRTASRVIPRNIQSSYRVEAHHGIWFIPNRGFHTGMGIWSFNYWDPLGFTGRMVGAAVEAPHLGKMTFSGSPMSANNESQHSQTPIGKTYQVCEASTPAPATPATPAAQPPPPQPPPASSEFPPSPGATDYIGNVFLANIHTSHRIFLSRNGHFRFGMDSSDGQLKILRLSKPHSLAPEGTLVWSNGKPLERPAELTFSLDLHGTLRVHRQTSGGSKEEVYSKPGNPTPFVWTRLLLTEEGTLTAQYYQGGAFRTIWTVP